MVAANLAKSLKKEIPDLIEFLVIQYITAIGADKTIKETQPSAHRKDR